MNTAHPTFSKLPTASRFSFTLSLALAALLALAACADKSAPTERAAQTNAPVANAPAANSPAAQTAQANAANANAAASPSPSATPAPPRAAEVSEKVSKIFQGAVRLDSPQSPTALVGDFNGDGSEDIAVVVRASPDKLADLNSEFANWIFIDPQKVALPNPDVAKQTPPPPPPRPQASANEPLLAVIHGYQQQGWRNPAAQQTYLLKNAVGRDLRAEDRQSALAEFRSIFPHLHTDVLREELDGKPGFLCWTGAKYAWLPTTKGK